MHFCDCGKHIFASKDKDLGVANLNVVNSSLGGLAPLSALNEMTTDLGKVDLIESRHKSLFWEAHY